jgi:hypothetical protein
LLLKVVSFSFLGMEKEGGLNLLSQRIGAGNIELHRLVNLLNEVYGSGKFRVEVRGNLLNSFSEWNLVFSKSE